MRFWNHLITTKNLYISGYSLTTILIILTGYKCFSIDNQAHKDYTNILEEKKQELVNLEKKYLLSTNQLLAIKTKRQNSLNDPEIDRKLITLIPTHLSQEEREKITTILQQNLVDWQKQNTLVQELEINQKIVNDSLRNLIFLRNEVLQDPAIFENRKQLATTLDELLQSILLYQKDLELYRELSILNKLEEIKDFNNSLPKNDLFYLNQAIEQVETIIVKIRHAQQLQEKIDLDHSQENLNLIINLYNNYYSKSIEKINTYRIALSIFIIIEIVLILIQIVSRLKQTNNSIVKILESFTEELEQKVEERTTQLENSVNEKEMALAQAQEANEAKSRFLANMSHELRTPLNSILGFTQLMCRDNCLDSQHQESLQIINRSGEHLLKIINDILEMSKIEAGQMTVDENEFDLYLLLKNLEEMLHLKAKFKNLKLAFICDDTVPKLIKADEGKLRQILINLLGNALKFTQEGSVILKVNLITQSSKENKALNFLFADSHFLHFEVIDTGSGIDATEIDKIFTPFEQTRLGRQTEEGTGLGLSICKKFVELMGGELEVKSILGEGTTFSFNLLVKEVKDYQLESHRRQKVISLAPNQHNYRILAVDDSSESRLLLVKILSTLGFEVKETANGQEAINCWKVWQPDLIFMDMRMPILDGYEATQHIKSCPEGQDTKIIALTASAFEEERIVMLSAGCDDFMSKPFYEGDLLEKIAEHLGVTYLYESTDICSSNLNIYGSSDNSIAEELTQEVLKLISYESRRELYKAADEVDNKKLFEIIDKISIEYQNIADQLTVLVNDFRCDKIIQLIEQIEIKE